MCLGGDRLHKKTFVVFFSQRWATIVEWNVELTVKFCTVPEWLCAVPEWLCAPIMKWEQLVPSPVITHWLHQWYRLLDEGGCISGCWNWARPCTDDTFWIPIAHWTGLKSRLRLSNTYNCSCFYCSESITFFLFLSCWHVFNLFCLSLSYLVYLVLEYCELWTSILGISLVYKSLSKSLIDVVHEYIISINL